MDFSSLVLMERDKEGKFIKEVGSYAVGDGADYVTKLFLVDGEVNFSFDTKRDVEEWEYSAIFDLFNEDAFKDLGYIIEEDDDKYNPTWIVKFKFDDDHEEMKAIINELCNLVKENMEKVFKDIKDKEEEYQD
ncbi:DUF6762 family protein [Clostridium fallax]|uniref:Uncharacterized protein n=1 Tax=Clostridium fallax TaxID=1533 RepID=A0A1M4Y8X4_9CLOT|nr:DUF6762 family protein [Clostridium fallax]SHF02046.1 hypothetical protein SAMN05443638_12510 [Clostridium fallax]SQB06023.1 Uncharacterised protein [Clostridium fallax]